MPVRLVRFAFALGAAALWCMVLFLAAELFLRYRFQRRMSAHEGVATSVPTMVPGQEVDPWNLDIPDMKHAKCLAPPFLRPAYGLSEPEITTLAVILLDARCGAPYLEEHVRLARRQFAMASEDNLNAIAALQGDLLCLLDADGRCLGLWGEPMLESAVLASLQGMPFGDLSSQQFFNHAPGEKRIAEVSTDTISPFRRFYEIYLLERPLLNGPARRVLLLRHTTFNHFDREWRPPADPDSLWDITSYRYKRSWLDATNSYGFPDDEPVMPKPEGLVRVVCVGGSTTQEGGRSPDLSYAKYLNREWKAALGPNAVDVLNCGVCSLESYIERERAPDYLALQPDLILYYNGINDIMRHSPTWLNQRPRWLARAAQSHVMRLILSRYLLPSEAHLANFIRCSTIRNLDALAYAARERGAQMAICSFAFPDPRLLSALEKHYLDINIRTAWRGVDYSAYLRVIQLQNTLVKELCERRGLIYVPFAEEFHHGLDMFRDACHIDLDYAPLKGDLIGRHVLPFVRQRLTDMGRGPKDATMPVSNSR